MGRFKEFKDKFEVPFIFSMDDFEWTCYNKKLVENNMNVTNIAPYNTENDEFLSALTYLVIGSIVFGITLFKNGIFSAILAAIATWITISIVITLFNLIVFIFLPYKKYSHYMTTKEKEEKAQRIAEERALKAGDVKAKYRNIYARFKNIKTIPKNVRIKFDKLMKDANTLIKLSEVNPGFVLDVSRYINIYLEEVMSSIEKNIEISKHGGDLELYAKYMTEIETVLDKMDNVFNDAIERMSRNSALPMDASLKAVSQMLDGEHRGGLDE